MQYLSYPFFREMALSYERCRYMFDGNIISLKQQYFKMWSLKLLKFARSWIWHSYAIKISQYCTANYFPFFSPFFQDSCCCLRPDPWAPHSVLNFCVLHFSLSYERKGRGASVSDFHHFIQEELMEDMNKDNFWSLSHRQLEFGRLHLRKCPSYFQLLLRNCGLH